MKSAQIDVEGHHCFPSNQWRDGAGTKSFGVQEPYGLPLGPMASLIERAVAYRELHNPKTALRRRSCTWEEEIPTEMGFEQIIDTLLAFSNNGTWETIAEGAKRTLSSIPEDNEFRRGALRRNKTIKRSRSLPRTLLGKPSKLIIIIFSEMVKHETCRLRRAHCDR